jgi:cell division protein ZipA
MHKDRIDTIRLTPKARREVDDDLVNPELPGAARVIAVREQPSLHVKRASTRGSVTRKEPPLSTTSEESADDILFTDPKEEYGRKVDVVDDIDGVHDVDAGWRGEIDDDDELGAPRTRDTELSAASTEARPTKEAKSLKSAQSTPSSHQELIVLNAMSPSDKPFNGNDLLQILMACDVRYGKMNIFHRYENADGTGEIQFSVANLVEPGNFDLDEIEGFTTPGVVFFMHLPGPADSIKAYEAMVETARCLVKNLDGELRDQTHSVATKQTLEHYKQRIRDFERRQLTLM